ncbi:uncharacterized protein LOC110856302 [Folsomia candida]|uniref:Uncharacterized protein n=1 Tax=Folsomia candida TaxID=158441 RepID=A0A226DNB0_FOLCA|nr:uncharacterized protein LOC110856302 [Folsomia candida]OXA46334.1 hypothetical protein Fcan01_18577 [Folsomia candida]
MFLFVLISTQIFLGSIASVQCVPLPLIIPGNYGLDVVNENGVGGESVKGQRQVQRPDYPMGRNGHLEVPINPNPSPFQSSMNNLVNSLTSSVRGIIQTGQHGLLRAIGTVDRTVNDVQTAAENSTFALVSEGQKAFAKIYDQTPQQVNRFIQRIGTVRDNRLYTQFNDLVNQWRDNRNKLYETFTQHGHEVHDVLQNAFYGANEQLGVQNLPRMKLGWYTN